jgi:hypothetical protein
MIYTAVHVFSIYKVSLVRLSHDFLYGIAVLLVNCLRSAGPPRRRQICPRPVRSPDAAVWRPARRHRSGGPMLPSLGQRRGHREAGVAGRATRDMPPAQRLEGWSQRTGSGSRCLSAAGRGLCHADAAAAPASRRSRSASVALAGRQDWRSAHHRARIVRPDRLGSTRLEQNPHDVQATDPRVAERQDHEQARPIGERRRAAMIAAADGMTGWSGK